MPSIHEIARGLNSATDSERIKHVNNLYRYTKRNVICYYSNFLSERTYTNTGIDDNDLHGIMSTVYKMDKSRGLDLFLHTPGGNAAATESIVSYLNSIFGNNIRAIIPHMAMSAGTMLACSCKEIIMGKHSSLGPIDPQYSGIPALDIIEEFDKAKSEIINNPSSAIYWDSLLKKYPVAIYEKCLKAIQLSDVLVRTWLSQNMLKGKTEAEIDTVLNTLNENRNSKTHSRHFDKEKCKNAGLVIYDLEDDPKLQDYVLSIHHCYVHFLGNNNYQKIIENQRGVGVLI